MEALENYLQSGIGSLLYPTSGEHKKRAERRRKTNKSTFLLPSLIRIFSQTTLVRVFDGLAERVEVG
jgi:hypothetical protein